MTEEKKDVKPTEANQSNSSTEKEQASNDQENVESQESKQADIHSNLQKAIEKEKAKLRKLREQRREVQNSPSEPEDPYDKAEKEETQWRNKVEAQALIAEKLVTDPSFKDRLDLVKAEMERTGKTLNEADSSVKSRLFDEVLTNSQPAQQGSFNQIKPSAIPEAPQQNNDWNMDNVLNGKSSTGNPYLDQALRNRAGY